MAGQVQTVHEEQQIQGMPGLCSNGKAWSPFGSGIYFLACPNNYREINFFDLNTKKTSRAFLPEKSPASDWMGGLPVSRDGKWLLYFSNGRAIERHYAGRELALGSCQQQLSPGD